MWKTVEKPSISFSNSGLTASGVTSRPVKPVPPVVITTSIAGIGDPGLHLGSDRGHVVLDDGSAATSWPAAAIISARVSPDLSSAAARVSDTVSTAMRTGMKGRALVDLRHARASSLWTAHCLRPGAGRSRARDDRLRRARPLALDAARAPGEHMPRRRCPRAACAPAGPARTARCGGAPRA